MVDRPVSEEELGPLARDHVAHPRNLGPLPAEGQGSRLIGEAGSTTSGAFVRFYLLIVAGCIRAVRYEVLGTPALIAAVSRYSELLTGVPERIDVVPPGLTVAEEIGLPRAQHGAALLAEDAARRALGQGA